MNLNEITSRLLRISDQYASEFGIRRDEDWYLLKVQEELGELSAAYLKLTDRARAGEATRDELADVICMTLLFARRQSVDVEAAIRDKWFQYLS